MSIKAPSTISTIFLFFSQRSQNIIKLILTQLLEISYYYLLSFLVVFQICFNIPVFLQ